MRAIIIAILGLWSTVVFAQSADTYEIETLTKPEKLLDQTASTNLIKYLKADLEKSSPLPDSLIVFGEHPFLTGILTAYKEHRPFVLSPDIIWVLISQGFARHISNNAEAFRKDIVNFENKKTLTIYTTEIALGNPESNWEAVFPQFVSQISDYTGRELTNILTANFSTSTPVTKIVSEITIMETVKEYFNYKVIMVGCGIPRIIINGTVEDWENLLVKTKYISKYDLGWWTKELEPIIKQIIQAKKGNFNKRFWMNMVKAHTEKKYGSPTTIDGWIIKFFPYTKEGKKTDLKPISKINNLASELVKVPFVLEDQPNQKTYQMEFWAGFVGLIQNREDYTLTTEIGWMINKKQPSDLKKSEFADRENMDDLTIGNISTIPAQIYSLKRIYNLHLSFLGNIIIPDELAKIKIDNLYLAGKITRDEELRISRLFPGTKLTINGLLATAPQPK